MHLLLRKPLSVHRYTHGTYRHIHTLIECVHIEVCTNKDLHAKLRKRGGRAHKYAQTRHKEKELIHAQFLL
jgi:hypothetical protein